jgi:nucleoid-associated protein YgaU
MTTSPAKGKQAVDATGAGQSYTVKAGDTLFTIAQQVYGDGNQWHAIYAANQSVIGPDPTQIKVAMVLTIPCAPSATTPPPPTPSMQRN